MGAGRVAVVIATVAAAAVTPASAGPRERAHCKPRGSETVVKDATARVYKIYSRADREHEIWACLYRTGRRTFLGAHERYIESDGAFVTPIALRGRYAAANQEESYHSSGAFSTVRVWDLRSGKVLHRWAQGGKACVRHTVVTEIRVDRAGSAAWIARVQRDCGATTQEVYKAEGRSRHARPLDAATTVDPHFLKLRDGRVYWKSGGEARSAPIR
jgi:hypothetical protein